MSTKNLHVNADSTLFLSAPKLEATRMSFKVKWMVEGHTVIKRCLLSSHRKTRRNLTCMLLSERSQWERLQTVRFHLYNILGKQNKETASTVMVARGWGGEG